MDEKVLLQVRVPETRSIAELRVPLDVTVEQGVGLMSRLLATRAWGDGAATQAPALMPLEGEGAGEVVAPWETFRSLVLQDRLRNGSLVMVV